MTNTPAERAAVVLLNTVKLTPLTGSAKLVDIFTTIIQAAIDEAIADHIVDANNMVETQGWQRIETVPEDNSKEGPLDWVLFCIRCGSVRKVSVIYDPPTDGRKEE